MVTGSVRLCHHPLLLPQMTRSSLNTSESWRILRPLAPVQSTLSSKATEERSCPGHPEMERGSRCLTIEAVGIYMLHFWKFHNAIGRSTPGKSHFNPALHSLREYCKESAVGRTHATEHWKFMHYLRRKYNAAVAYHCSNVFGYKITEVNWLPRSPKADAIDTCLKMYPGTVHIWVTSKDIEALFFPDDEDCKLPYLYPALPVGEGSEVTTHASEQSQPTPSSASCPSMSVSAATEHLPVSIQ